MLTPTAERHAVDSGPWTGSRRTPRARTGTLSVRPPDSLARPALHGTDEDTPDVPAAISLGFSVASLARPARL